MGERIRSQKGRTRPCHERWRVHEKYASRDPPPVFERRVAQVRTRLEYACTVPDRKANDPNLSHDPVQPEILTPKKLPCCPEMNLKCAVWTVVWKYIWRSDEWNFFSKFVANRLRGEFWLRYAKGDVNLYFRKFYLQIRSIFKFTWSDRWLHRNQKLFPSVEFISCKSRILN